MINKLVASVLLSAAKNHYRIGMVVESLGQFDSEPYQIVAETQFSIVDSPYGVGVIAKHKGESGFLGAIIYMKDAWAKEIKPEAPEIVKNFLDGKGSVPKPVETPKIVADFLTETLTTEDGQQLKQGDTANYVSVAAGRYYLGGLFQVNVAYHKELQARGREYLFFADQDKAKEFVSKANLKLVEAETVEPVVEKAKRRRISKPLPIFITEEGIPLEDGMDYYILRKNSLKIVKTTYKAGQKNKMGKYPSRNIAFFDPSLATIYRDFFNSYRGVNVGKVGVIVRDQAELEELHDFGQISVNAGTIKVSEVGNGGLVAFIPTLGKEIIGKYVNDALNTDMIILGDMYAFRQIASHIPAPEKFTEIVVETGLKGQTKNVGITVKEDHIIVPKTKSKSIVFHKETLEKLLAEMSAL